MKFWRWQIRILVRIINTLFARKRELRRKIAVYELLIQLADQAEDACIMQALAEGQYRKVEAFYREHREELSELAERLAYEPNLGVPGLRVRMHAEGIIMILYMLGRDEKTLFRQSNLIIQTLQEGHWQLAAYLQEGELNYLSIEVFSLLCSNRADDHQLRELMSTPGDLLDGLLEKLWPLQKKKA